MRQRRLQGKARHEPHLIRPACLIHFYKVQYFLALRVQNGLSISINGQEVQHGNLPAGQAKIELKPSHKSDITACGSGGVSVD
eukprot:scaffold270173_cov41-Prasinocladus_malaysianus.AAC.1